MKKLFLFIAIILFTGNLINAQNNIGFFVGGGISDMRMVDSTKSLTKEINKEMQFSPSYYGGINFENIIIERQLYLLFGLQAISRGYKADNDSVSFFIHNAYIPLEIKYKYFFSKRGEGNVFVSAGPYVAASYKGTKKNIAFQEAVAADTTGLLSFSPEMKFGKLGSDDTEAIDYGVNASIGFGYSHLQVAYNFSMGLHNMIPSQTFKDTPSNVFVPKLKHMNHSITVGFYFTNN
ncbi:MAG: hypothetical protein DRI94_09070 [Bacteroidetes bacterium]|nr:MAG: hypothetical protein DRI94_09070 [Bacteroidota bacterium]